MPDLYDRDVFEKKLAALIGDRLNSSRDKLIKALGDPPNPDNVPQSLWDEIGTELTAVIQPQLQQIYAQSGQALNNSLAIQYPTPMVDWTMINQQAADWAKTYTFDLVKDINETSITQLQDNVSAFFEQGQTLDKLAMNIEEGFSPARAAMIARTEVTRASVQGEIGTVNEIEANSSLKMVNTFQTENDDIVCDICSPLNGTEVDEDNYPPVHPQCRCWLNWAPEGW